MPRVVWVLVAGLALACRPSAVDAVPAGQPSAPTEKPRHGSAEAIIEALRQPADFDFGDIEEVPLLELIRKLGKRHGIAFVILEERFKEENVADIREKKPTLAATGFKGMTLHQFLTLTLDSMRATYLVKSGRVEIVPLSFAEAAARGERGMHLAEGETPPPLVSVVVSNKPLRDVVNALADEYDLSVVISPKVGKALDEPVSARLLNVPSDVILDRLVVAADVRVARRGNTFVITTPEHAKELAAERLEQERHRLELMRLRGEIPIWFPPNLPGLGGPVP